MDHYFYMSSGDKVWMFLPAQGNKLSPSGTVLEMRGTHDSQVMRRTKSKLLKMQQVEEIRAGV
jgi:hypothetical protein